MRQYQKNNDFINLLMNFMAYLSKPKLLHLQNDVLNIFNQNSFIHVIGMPITGKTHKVKSLSYI